MEKIDIRLGKLPCRELIVLHEFKWTKYNVTNFQESPVKATRFGNP